MTAFDPQRTLEESASRSLIESNSTGLRLTGMDAFEARIAVLELAVIVRTLKCGFLNVRFWL